MKHVNRFSNSTNTVNKVGDLFSDNSGSNGVSSKFLASRIKDSKIGVAKYPVNRYSRDHLMECIVYDLGKLFNVSCCKATLEIYDNKDCVLSEFYEDGNFKSCRSLLGSNKITEFNKRFNLDFIKNNVGSNAVDDFIRMVFLDLITMQVDRHISNFGFKNNRMYPLFDNGRCLFYDSPKEEIPVGNFDFTKYLITNEHGYGYSLIDSLDESHLISLINLKVSREDVQCVFSKWLSDDLELVELLTNFVWKMFTSIIWWR